MAIIGSRIWYHPRWFARYVPNPDIEGKRLNERLAQGTVAGERTAVGAAGTTSRSE
jgi:RND superfamily putative drug exporter